MTTLASKHALLRQEHDGDMSFVLQIVRHLRKLVLVTKKGGEYAKMGIKLMIALFKGNDQKSVMQIKK